MSKPLLSVCIIFKNEIRCLERCLKSLEPLKKMIPVELVMADTGSDDGSREVAAKYADILFDFPWINDFAAARNAVMDRANGTWFMTLDCDEWLGGDIAELAQFLSKTDFDYGSVIIRNYDTEDVTPDANYADFTGIRLIRASTGARYEGAIHEHFKSGYGKRVVQLRDFLLHHDGYVTKNWEGKNKIERNMVPLKKELEEQPENLLVILQCMESGDNEPEFLDYVQRGIRGVKEHYQYWEKLGPPILRLAVMAAAQRQMPEMEEWTALAQELFPDNLFTRIDVGYYAAGDCWNKNDFAGCARWGWDYVEAVRTFESKQYDLDTTVYSAMMMAAPLRQQCVYILLPWALIKTGQMEKARAALELVNGAAFDGKRAEDFARILLRVHSRSEIDCSETAARLWTELGEKGRYTRERRQRFLDMAANAFSPSWCRKEANQPDFQRPGYTLFKNIPDCPLSIAAAVMEARSVSDLEAVLNQVENWDEFPIFSLEQALLHGARFPLPNKPLPVEELDKLAVKLAKNGQEFDSVVERALEHLDALPGLSWARALTLAAVRFEGWRDPEAGQTAARQFAQVEEAYLPLCYAPGVLTEENIWTLPPMHRFGWYCAKAFRFKNAGNQTEYVALLRKGLSSAPEMRSMVEFLLERFEEEQRAAQAPDPELLELAEKVKGILSQYAPDDPAVAELKGSPAYQKVAWLIEDPAAPPFAEGIKQ